MRKTEGRHNCQGAPGIPSNMAPAADSADTTPTCACPEPQGRERRTPGLPPPPNTARGTERCSGSWLRRWKKGTADGPRTGPETLEQVLPINRVTPISQPRTGALTERMKEEAWELENTDQSRHPHRLGAKGSPARPTDTGHTREMHRCLGRRGVSQGGDAVHQGDEHGKSLSRALAVVDSRARGQGAHGEQGLQARSAHASAGDPTR